MKAWQNLLESNDVAHWLIAVGIFVAVLVAVPVIRYVAARLFSSVSRRTGVAWGDALADILQRTSVLLFVPLAAYAAMLSLAFPQRVERATALFAIAAAGSIAGFPIRSTNCCVASSRTVRLGSPRAVISSAAVAASRLAGRRAFPL